MAQMNRSLNLREIWGVFKPDFARFQVYLPLVSRQQALDYLPVS